MTNNEAISILNEADLSNLWDDEIEAIQHLIKTVREADNMKSKKAVDLIEKLISEHIKVIDVETAKALGKASACIEKVEELKKDNAEQINKTLNILQDEIANSCVKANCYRCSSKSCKESINIYALLKLIDKYKR